MSLQFQILFLFFLSIFSSVSNAGISVTTYTVPSCAGTGQTQTPALLQCETFLNIRSYQISSCTSTSVVFIEYGTTDCTGASISVPFPSNQCNNGTFNGQTLSVFVNCGTGVSNSPVAASSSPVAASSAVVAASSNVVAASSNVVAASSQVVAASSQVVAASSAVAASSQKVAATSQKAAASTSANAEACRQLCRNAYYECRASNGANSRLCRPTKKSCISQCGKLHPTKSP